MSIDGIGFNGPVLRKLQDPQGLNLDVVVPPKESAGKTFEPQAFVEDPDRGGGNLPGGTRLRTIDIEITRTGRRSTGSLARVARIVRCWISAWRKDRKIGPHGAQERL